MRKSKLTANNMLKLLWAINNNDVTIHGKRTGLSITSIMKENGFVGYSVNVIKDILLSERLVLELDKKLVWNTSKTKPNEALATRLFDKFLFNKQEFIRQKKIALSVTNGEVFTSDIKTEEPVYSLSAVSANALVKELRDRGYTVTCQKTVEL